MARKTTKMVSAVNSTQIVSDTDPGRPASSDTNRKRSSSDTPDESQQQLCPQQRYAKRPRFPGMVTFDGGLRQLPIHGSSRELKDALSRSTATVVSIDNVESTDPSDIETEDDALSEYHGSVPDEVVVEASTSTLHATTMPDNLIDLYSSGQMLNDVPWHSIAKLKNSPISPESKFIHMSSCAQELKVDAMAIYADLIRDNMGKRRPMLELPETATAQDREIWKAWHGLRHGLLQKSHDYMWTSQSTDAPQHLKLLAARYGATSRTTKAEIDGFIAPLYEMEPAYWSVMLALVDRSRLLLEKIEQTVPSSAHDMRQANDNIHLYSHVLIAAGVQATICPYNCGSYTESDRWLAWRAFKMSPPNTLNDDLRERHLRKNLTLENLIATDVEAAYMATCLPMEEPALCLLSGWLAIGPAIANTFHEFCKVFKFLAWIGPSA